MSTIPETIVAHHAGIKVEYCNIIYNVEYGGHILKSHIGFFETELGPVKLLRRILEYQLIN